jgi:hypothetical protein
LEAGKKAAAHALLKGLPKGLPTEELSNEDLMAEDGAKAAKVEDEEQRDSEEKEAGSETRHTRPIDFPH